MHNNRGTTALISALILLCAVVALEWYAHAGARTGKPDAVPAATALPPNTNASSAPKPSSTSAPIVYVPQDSPPTPVSAPSDATSAPSGAMQSAAPTETPTLEASGATPQAGTPFPLVTLGPTATMPGVIREAPNEPPRILALSLSTAEAHAGDVVSGFVETSSNVASVEARIAGYGTSMRKIGVGKFVLTYRVPKLPFFLRRTYNINVIARNTHGDAVSASVPIAIR